MSMQLFIIDASERLDAASVNEFKQETHPHLEGSDALLVINFENTKFIDSAGLGTLVSILKLASQQSNVKLALIALSPQINQIFELTKLYRLFEIFETLEDAKEALLH